MMMKVLVFCALGGAHGLAAKSKKAKPATKGFGAVSEPKALPSDVLLAKSEKRYDELETKYSNDDSCIFRDFVITLRAPGGEMGGRLCDWVPIACIGLADARESKAVVPVALSTLRRELLEAARQELGGSAAKKVASSSELEFAYEPLDSWNSRVLETIKQSRGDRRGKLSDAAATLSLGDDADLNDSETLRDAYKEAAKMAHPDAKREGGSTASVGDVKAAYKLLTEASEVAASDYSTTAYNLIGGGKARDFSGAVEVSKKVKETALEAAVCRIDSDIISPFLARNIRRSQAAVAQQQVQEEVPQPQAA